MPVQRAVRSLAGTLARERTLAQAAAAVDTFFRIGEEYCGRVGARGSGVACVEACAHCCSCGEVIVTSAEVIRVVVWLRGHWEAARIHALAERAARLAPLFRERNAGGRATAPLPCPLLENARCTAYPVRPFVCRGCNSLDASRCADAFGPHPRDRRVPALLPQVQFWQSLRTGLSIGLATLGYPYELLDLAVALDIALSDAQAAEAWVRGEPVFAPARREIAGAGPFCSAGG